MSADRPHAGDDPNHARRWVILGVIGIAQLMVVLDATIVNVALPSVQSDLGFSNDDRQWVITAYALAFGSLLLLGGRIGDLFGRKWTFIGGLLGFAVASAIGGAAGSFGVLVFARALQGVFGAILAPAALSLLTVTFTDPAERGKAFGIFGAIAGGGAAIGLLLGGILTEWLSWRWCLYVNLLFAVPAAIAGFALITDRVNATRPRLDIPGTVTACAGLFLLVFGFAKAETEGWGAGITLACLIAGVLLLVAFVALQTRVAHPLLPMRVVLDRNRGGSYLAVGISGAGMFGVFLFLTFYLQQTLDLSPIQTGLGFLPMSFAIMATATLGNTVLVPKLGPRPLITAGMTLAALALAWFAQLDVDSTYLTVLPGLLVMGVGMGCIFAPAFAGATLGVDHHDAGVASAMVNTAQQVGGSIGTAFLSTMANTATTSFLQERGAQARAPEVLASGAVHGFTTAFWWSAGIFVVGAIVAWVTLRPGNEGYANVASAAPAAAH